MIRVFTRAAEEILIKPPYVVRMDTKEWGGNAILETAQFLWIKDIVDGLDEADNMRLWAVYADAVVSPGLLSRGSHKKLDPQRHDDIVGFSSIAGRLEPILAERVYQHGNRNGWEYKLPHLSGLKEWLNAQFWRMPGVVQTIKMAANKELSWFDKIWLSIDLVVGVTRHNGATSDRLMDWCIIKLYEHKRLDHWLVNLAIRVWKNDIRRRYPNLMGDVFTVYYGSNHVFARFMQGVLTERNTNGKSI